MSHLLLKEGMYLNLMYTWNVNPVSRSVVKAVLTLNPILVSITKGLLEWKENMQKQVVVVQRWRLTLKMAEVNKLNKN